jgi:adenosylmethionine-8-amino-7-oxononanoate aminotransferase
VIGLASDTRPAIGGYQDLFYSRINTQSLPTMVRGDGIYLWDVAGNRYLDVVSGAFTATLGQGNRRVLQAMYDQGTRLTYSYVRVSRHEPNLELSGKIARLAGPGYERCHITSGGSEAVEMGVKFLRQYAVAKGHAAKTHVITLMPSYHGGTLATLGWTGDDDIPAVWHGMTVPSAKIPAPLSYRPSEGTTSEDGARASAAALERTIVDLGAENVLAFMFEPVGGQSTGANVPHPLFFSEVRRICDKHGIFLIFDEVMAAVRTGTFLAAHRHRECRPDIVVTAKGIGAGYTPMGVMLAPAAMVDELSGLTGFNLSHTYNANPIACAAASAVIDEIVERDLIENANPEPPHGTGGPVPDRRGCPRRGSAFGHRICDRQVRQNDLPGRSFRERQNSSDRSSARSHALFEASESWALRRVVHHRATARHHA